MAANVTVIGRTTRVRGRVTGSVDLEVQGFVEGEIAVGGDVTIDSPGIVGAGIRGRRLIVRGAVKGDLVGDESIRLEAGARVVGDLRAPRVAIAQGALVRGYVQTGDVDATASHSAAAAGTRAVRVQPAARPLPMQPAARPVHTVNAEVAAHPKGPPAPAKIGRAEPSAARAAGAASNAGPRRPPPPVVPALR